MQHYDIAIVGNGMTGLTLAHLLQQQTTLRIALIGDKGPASSIQDNRVCAFNQLSLAIFAYSGLEPFLQAPQHCHYQHLAIYLDQVDSHPVHFTATEYAMPRLGCIMTNTDVEQAWWELVERGAHIDHYHSTITTQWRYAAGNHQLTLADNTTLSASLLIGADGQRSWVRQQLGIPVQGGGYGQSAIVATIKTQLPHQQTARQIFLPTGPVGLLPMGDAHHVSIVWSCEQAVSDAYMQASDADFATQLTDKVAPWYGQVTLQSQRTVFPLRYQHARTYVAPYAAIVGDAAHTAHPLAGQGVNMSLLDAAVLADELVMAAAGQQDYQTACRRYQIARRSANSAWIAAMGRLHAAYTRPSSMRRWLLGLGMDSIQRLPASKRALVRVALGRPQDLPASIRDAALGWMPN